MKKEGSERAAMRLHLLARLVVLVRIVFGSNAVGTGQHGAVCNAHACSRAFLDDMRNRREQPLVTGTAEARLRFLICKMMKLRRVKPHWQSPD